MLLVIATPDARAQGFAGEQWTQRNGREAGRPYFAARFTARDYEAHRQNWAVVQTPDGVVWVGNTEGLLRFDGVRWSRLSLPGETVRSLAVGADGRLYVGGIGTLGYIASSGAGNATYVELLGRDRLHDEDVWSTLSIGENIAFQTTLGLFWLRGTDIQQIASTTPENRFHKTFVVGIYGREQLLVRQDGVGLQRYNQDTNQLISVAGGHLYATDRIRALFVRPSGGLLIASSTGLDILDNGVRSPLSLGPGVEEFLEQHGVYDGAEVTPGAYALGTLGGGVLLVNEDGAILQWLGIAAGLTTRDLVLDLEVDIQGGLWLAMGSGIARFDALAPLSFFDADLGLPGSVYDLQRVNGHLYAATESGVYRLGMPRTVGAPAHFESVGIRDEARVLLVVNDGVLVATTSGVYEILASGTNRLLWEGPVVDMVQSASDSSRVLLGTPNGVYALRWTNRGWRDPSRVAHISGSVQSIVEQPDGNVWVATRDSVIVMKRLSGINDAFEVTHSYPLGGASLGNLNGIAIVTNTVVWRPDETWTLRSDEELTRIVRGDDTTRALAWSTDQAGRLWVSRGGAVRAYQHVRSRWREVTPAALRTLRDALRSVYTEGTTVWVGTETGLLRYQATPALNTRYSAASSVVLWGRLTSVDRWDARAGIRGEVAGLTVQSARDPIRFEFATPAFNGVDGNRYRTRLRGSDLNWTAWTNSTSREFTNLEPGTYRFEVEAMTAQGIRTSASSIELRVTPRWFETWWARTTAAALLVGLVVSVSVLRIRVHVRRAQAEKNRADHLAGLNLQLQEADKLKDQMLANASHELRTPLTAILGYADLLAEFDGTDTPEEVRETAGFILSGARRLNSTVQDLMDAAALRAGRMELLPERLDLVHLVLGVISDCNDQAAAKGLTLNARYGEEALDTASPIVIEVDRQRFRTIVGHILDNAIKFTDSGYVQVDLEVVQNKALVTIADSGRGIEAQFIPYLFDEFKQESTGEGRGYEGNGLGLFIVGRLARLMGVELSVESSPRFGTRVQLAVHTTHVPLAWGADDTTRVQIGVAVGDVAS